MMLKKFIFLLAILLPTLVFSQGEKEDFNALKAKATKLYTSGDYKNALPELDKAIELKPEATELYEMRAVANRWRGNPEAALEDYNLVIAKKPSAKAYAERASVRPHADAKGKYEDLTKAVSLNGDEFEFVYQLAMLQHKSIVEFYESEDRTEPITAALFEDKFGFSPDACPNFNKAATLNSGFKDKATYYCQTISEILQ